MLDQGLLGVVTAVVPLVVVQPELPTVVTAAHEAWHAVGVIVVPGAVTLGLAVALPQAAGGEDGAAAPLLLVVPPAAPLTLGLLQQQRGVIVPPSEDLWRRVLRGMFCGIVSSPLTEVFLSQQSSFG